LCDPIFGVADAPFDRDNQSVGGLRRHQLIISHLDLVCEQCAGSLASAFDFNRKAAQESSCAVILGSAERVALLFFNFGDVAQIHLNLGARYIAKNETVGFALDDDASEPLLLPGGDATHAGGVILRGGRHAQTQRQPQQH
jgi:hypothetical protein